MDESLEGSTAGGQVLLFVCHANVCRSPMAERLTRLAAETRPALRAAGLHVASAGTHARAGSPMHPPAAEVLGRLGADASDFRSRILTVSLISQSTVALTATRDQRAAIATLVPSAVRRVFTLRQFARLASTLEAGCLAGIPAGSRLSALVDEAPRARARTQPVTAADDDLADPVNGTLDDVWSCAGEIQRSLDRVLAVIERN